MERDNILYILRRKCQVVAHHLFPDEMMSKLYFKLVLNQKLDIKNPKTFNEKIQWMKLYYYPKNELTIQCSDKYAVREYIKDKGLESKLVPILGVWDNADDINWDDLPDKFVLKCNHGCAYNIVVNDKKATNRAKTNKQLNQWLREDFGAFNIELHYSKIKRHCITCEEFLGEAITDYKFFCFNGVPKYIYVSKDLVHDRQAQIGFFYLNGDKMLLHRDDYTDISSVTFPAFYDEMKNAAITLCKDFPFVRVDFFVANNQWYFAELTFTPSAGMMPFNPQEFDLKWGQDLDISNLI
jgi:hypothetical protein